ncbi:PhzF family phenazine biosynthesis protein [Roseomonas xinghualingensis]|uniref:PhzF family phenazine biosynthesis protein n=1 Tax=Roseomonas xinghualingensis TaxID=2986475 RepID=UPI0021F12ACF|nr:PhzF family phenazine biosynthesis protein [Roseomonas sp. SXEYE001]MCV4207643.1 PhzF family phenazine biosynthesis protein [Roseomonas sp. SXEYE001]
MRAYRFVTVDVFTDRRFGGNPLAVFPDARGMSDAEMQALATEFNLSETTFALPPEDPSHSARVRIFTRQYEMPFAGHPNVGTGYVLANEGRDRDGRLVFEEIAGLVEVDVERAADGAVTGATIAAPQPLSLGLRLEAGPIADCAGLETAEIRTGGHPPVQAGMGNPFIIAEVAPEALSRARPDIAAFQRIAAAQPALNGRVALYLYARDGQGVRARMFAPLGGTLEDAATGSAATPLAGLLLSLSGEAEARFDITQGVEMGRPSLLRTTARRTPDGIRATVGGGCVPVLRGEALL